MGARAYPPGQQLLPDGCVVELVLPVPPEPVLLGVHCVVGGGGSTQSGTCAICAPPEPTCTLSGLLPVLEQLIWKRTCPLDPVGEGLAV
ncbi:MAG TPA: hypothetical protein VNE21_04965 [Mycobacteriales bacterium]|nr:hypothetical protein [Mycobacteriales bacterium]